MLKKLIMNYIKTFDLGLYFDLMQLETERCSNTIYSNYCEKPKFIWTIKYSGKFC